MSRRFKLVCGVGLVVPGLLARALESHAAPVSEPRDVTMGRRYTVKVVTARVDYECSGCNKSGTNYDEPLPDGIEVPLRFIPDGGATPVTFAFMSEEAFVPPVSGRLVLDGDALTPEAIGELERRYSGQCSGLEVTGVVLGELQLHPREGEP